MPGCSISHLSFLENQSRKKLSPLVTWAMAESRSPWKLSKHTNKRHDINVNLNRAVPPDSLSCI
jgi:hypothetical protein